MPGPFAKTQVIPLFPTFVWAHDLAPEQAKPFNDHLVAAIERLIEPRPKLQPGQNWQTHQDLHERADFAELVQLIHLATKGVLEFLKAEPHPFEITGCWANVNPDGSPHVTHTHPNNYLSGVYYVRTGSGADRIRFVDPRKQTLLITPRFAERASTNSYEAFINVPEGRMVMFPAWLAHSVPHNVSGHERVSIAFNVMFSDFTRTVAKPLWDGIRAKEERDE